MYLRRIFIMISDESQTAAASREGWLFRSEKCVIPIRPKPIKPVFSIEPSQSYLVLNGGVYSLRTGLNLLRERETALW